jgi:long-subunit fatty acid transport protein
MQHTTNAVRSCARGIFAAVVLSTATAHADSYHYNNILIGDRAAGLGGAYSAISDDPSGLYYNPAGIALAAGASLNGSVNAYNSTSSEYKNVFGDKSWKRESSGLIPNFFGLIQPFAGGMAGFSVVVTDAVADDQDQHFSNFTPSGGADPNKDYYVNDFYINFNNQDTTYNIGPSFAFKPSDDIAVGLSLYGHFRKQQFILNQQVYRRNGEQIWTNGYFQIAEYGVNPVLGVMWSPLDRLSLGLSLRKTIVLQSSSRRQVTNKDADAAVIVQPTIDTSTVRRDRPLQLNLGSAYFANDRLLFSGDLTWNQSVDNSPAVLNFALGSEFYLNPRWALRAGLFSNLANTPALGATQTGQPEHVDLYGGTFSVTNFTRNSSLSVGVNASLGNGQAQVLASGVQELQVWTLTTFIAASNSF